MINYSDSVIEKVALHRIGNKTNGEELLLAHAELEIANEQLKSSLMKYFLDPFETPEYHSFTAADGDVKSNGIYTLCTQVFENNNKFFPAAVDIAKQLYELSAHPQIKAGDLFVAYISNLQND